MADLSNDKGIEYLSENAETYNGQIDILVNNVSDNLL